MPDKKDKKMKKTSTILVSKGYRGNKKPRGFSISLQGCSRVARWYIFKPKILIWVNSEGSYNGTCWYIIWTFGIFFGRLVYFATIWYILRVFGIFFPSFGMLYQETSGNPGVQQNCFF
jgi:hypothetical protein